METYLWINPERFRTVGEQTTVDGVDVLVELSPFDTPHAVRGKYLANLKVFEIVFEYLGSEPAGTTRREGPIEFIEGRHSGKLLAIRISVDSKPLDSVGLIRLQTKIVEALEKRAAALDPKKHPSSKYGRFLNSRAAQEVVANEGEFRSVAKAMVVP